VFWGNSTESKKIFQLQKKIIRIVTGSRSRTHCKPQCKSLEILTLPSQYILSSMKFLSYSLEFYTSNFSVYGINMRSSIQLHKPIANLTLCQKGMYYTSIKIFNELPAHIPELVEDKKRFISTLKK
jgi:hypothetical protein